MSKKITVLKRVEMDKYKKTLKVLLDIRKTLKNTLNEKSYILEVKLNDIRKKIDKLLKELKVEKNS